MFHMPSCAEHAILCVGLDYVHTGCVLPIVHSDLKSHNILLGHDMVAKISDFGLSKSYLNAAQSHISVTAAGTLGYIDPEFVPIPTLSNNRL